MRKMMENSQNGFFCFIMKDLESTSNLIQFKALYHSGIIGKEQNFVAKIPSKKFKQ